MQFINSICIFEILIVVFFVFATINCSNSTDDRNRASNGQTPNRSRRVSRAQSQRGRSRNSGFNLNFSANRSIYSNTRQTDLCPICYTQFGNDIKTLECKV